MKILSYDKNTGEFIKESDAKPNPLESNAFLIPANAVSAGDFPLPTLLANEAAVWGGADWVVTPDFRSNSSWFIIATGEVKVFELGESPSVSVSETFPADIQAALDEQQRISEIKAAGLLLINSIFPSLQNIDDIEFQAEFWLSIAPAARQATTDFQMVINVYQAAKTAIQENTPSTSVIWP